MTFGFFGSLMTAGSKPEAVVISFSKEGVVMFLLDVASRSMGLSEVAFRLACALIIGVVIGIERETAHRPAGMRTHMLVALGSCAVMITSQLMFSEYHALGANPDPGRLSAQVIAGVGFLGAGTIIREGASVKGLTTAASIWTVACLGIAVGAGYYFVGLVGMCCVLVTLTVFEWLQEKLIGNRSGSCHYEMRCADIAEGIRLIHQAAEKSQIKIRSIHTEKLENNLYCIQFHGGYHGRKPDKTLDRFFGELAAQDAVMTVSAEKLN